MLRDLVEVTAWVQLVPSVLTSTSYDLALLMTCRVVNKIVLAPLVRGLAQSKTLTRMIMALVCAKRLGRRWPGTVFFPRRGASTFSRKQNRDMIYGNALSRIPVLRMDSVER
jgi:hypothetical protein